VVGCGKCQVTDRCSSSSTHTGPSPPRPLLPPPFFLQDGRGCLTPTEVCQHLGLPELRGRRWQVQGATATQGLGLYEGLDWLSQTLRSSK